MNLYLIYLLILILTIIFFIIIKDKLKALKLTGILTISSAILLIVITFIIKIILNTNITTINISNITNYIFQKFINNSLIIFILGLIEIILSKYIQYTHIKKKENNNIIVN